MKRFKANVKLFAVFLLVSLAAFIQGCASQQISNTSSSPLLKNTAIVNDFKATASNLNQAVAIGVLPASDPAVGCINDALVATGITPPPAPVLPAGQVAPPTSFQAVNAGAISAGSIAYIRLHQAKAAPIVVSVNCKTLLGQFQIDGLTAAANPIQTIENAIGLPTFR